MSMYYGKEYEELGCAANGLRETADQLELLDKQFYSAYAQVLRRMADDVEFEMNDAAIQYDLQHRPAEVRVALETDL